METVLVNQRTSASRLGRSRALLISPVRPDPRGVGLAQRAYQWMLRLGENHEVHLLVITRAGPVATCDPARTDGLPVAAFYQLGPTPRRMEYLFQSARDRIASWLSRRSAAFGATHEWAFLTPKARRQLQGWFAGMGFTRAVCFRLQTRDYARWFVAAGIVPPTAMELDLDDLESATRASLAGLHAARGEHAIVRTLRRQVVSATEAETEASREFGLIHLAAPEDAAPFALRCPKARIAITPNRLPALPEFTPPADTRRMLFVGTLGYYPNEDALRFFIDSVLPALRRHDPRWTLVVAGRGGSLRLLQILQTFGAGLQFAGAVEDLTELYQTAGIVVAPVRGGGGTKIKVIEGLAHGRPVVATTHALRGWDLQDSENVLRADTADEWVAACQRLATDLALAARIGAAGRSWVAQHAVMGSTAFS